MRAFGSARERSGAHVRAYGISCETDGTFSGAEQCESHASQL